MLTADLAIAAFERDGRTLRALPDRLTRERHGQYLDLAGRCLDLYRTGAGRNRQSLHRAVADLFANEPDCPPRRIGAFCKLLDEASVFAADPAGEAAALRLRLFARAAEFHPLVEEKHFVFEHPLVEARAALEREFGRPWAELETALYRDVLSEQPLLRCPDLPDAAGLLARYNVAQTQAALYRATALTIEAGEDFRHILVHARLARLLHEIHPAGEGRLRITLSGPASALEETRRYGAAMAAFLPALLPCADWRLRARLKAPWGEAAWLDLSPADGLTSHLPPPPTYDSAIEEHFAGRFTSVRDGWTLRREATVLHEGQSIFFPDFTLRHEDGTEVLLEIVGFWTPEYLAAKRKTIAQFRDRRILLAVAENLLERRAAERAAAGEEPAPDGPGFVRYKTVLRPGPVLEAAERLRLAARQSGAVRPPALRDYQHACLQAIRAAWNEGARRQLVCLPTGTGKTVIFAEFPRFFAMKKRMLVLAHRTELLDQAVEKIRRAAPHLTVGVDQGEREAGPECAVVVASVPTLGREGSARLARLDPESFSLIVVDEAHHATAPTYRRIFDHFGLFTPGTPRLLVGFTATPKRGDGTGLHAVFERIVFSRALPEMIEAGHLCPLAGWRVETEVDLSRVSTRLGDYVVSDLAREVNVEGRNRLLVEVHRKHLADRKTLVFCADVAHAEAVAAEFAKAGIPAGAVSGRCAPEVRRQILERFRRNDLRVLANCMVLTEGYDEPSVDGVLLARPTRSSLLYTQMIGRATRLHPGKTDARVVDVVDATREHQLVTLPSLFGLSDRFDLEGRTVEAAREAMRWVEENRPWVNVEESRSLSDLRWRCTKIDLVDLATPLEVEGCSRFAWTRIGRNRFRLGLAGGEAVEVASSILDQWEVAFRGRGTEEALASHDSLEAAIAAAEAWVEAGRADEIGLVSRHTRWRAAPASEKQMSLLRSRDLTVPAGLTRGQASHLISMLLARGGA